MNVADLTLEQFKRFIKETVQEALEEHSLQTSDEANVWLETSAHDLAKFIAVAEATVSEQELTAWLSKIESSVKPLGI
jgi:hypothetical protein